MNTKWTSKNIPDLTGKKIIVTGGNSGLGFESVKALAIKGADLILASRSIEKGETAKQQIIADNPNVHVTVMQLDLLDSSSIKNFTNKYKKKYKQLDVLLNNAGIMATQYSSTKDGFEIQMATNHLGHFALTGLLLDIISKTQNSRVVNVSSLTHQIGNMDFKNLLFKGGKDYSPMKAYGRSKLANILFTYELQRFFEANNINSIAVAAHPGYANTKLVQHLFAKFLYILLTPFIYLILPPQAQAALSEIRASVDPNVKGGEYYGPDGFTGMKGFPVVIKSNDKSYNIDDAKKLWEISEKLTGVYFEK